MTSMTSSVVDPDVFPSARFESCSSIAALPGSLRSEEVEFAGGGGKNGRFRGFQMAKAMVDFLILQQTGEVTVNCWLGD